MTVAYCRVSSHDEKADLERQAGRVLTGASERGIRIDRTVTEIGSGLDGRRTRLRKLLGDPKVLTSMCARLYGRRSASRRAAAAVAAIRNEPDTAPGDPT